MGRRCCVANCPSTSRLLEHNGVTYHSFPLDPIIRAIWIKNSRISLERQITKSVLVCSRHFRRLDFNTIRNGKYLLKPRVFPTVFPWGKMDTAEIEADQRALQHASVEGTTETPGNAQSSTNDDVIKATVDQIVAQILSESAERKATEEGKTGKAADDVKNTPESGEDANKAAAKEPSGTPVAASSEATVPAPGSASSSNSPLPGTPPKYSNPHNLTIGARLEALSVEGNWLPARIVEVNETEQTLLVRFERNHKLKVSPSTSGSFQEWMAIKSERLRQRLSNRVLPVFELDEKCMARWSGPRKFPGTIRKLLGNDTYEVLFDDGYVKNVRAVHMNKMPKQLPPVQVAEEGASKSPTPVGTPVSSAPVAPKRASTGSLGGSSGSSGSKKSKCAPQRRDWPLLDMASLDIASLGLPEIPHDGEWTCHWVNDQPIGTEGFLIVGEHQKPTVIVQDWRLPPGWIKHMYQRSNVLGKWDVILVSPSGKRFRSKSDLKLFLESQNLVYNPDVYDFSIHRRRAKDINAYVYTHGYNPQPPPKPRPMDVSMNSTLDQSITSQHSLPSTPMPVKESQYMEAPVASLMPPAELMSPQTQPADETKPKIEAEILEASEGGTSQLMLADPHVVENGFAFIGGLKVKIQDNLYVCPREDCAKTYRKEDFLLIHIRHYHKEFAEHVSHCPKMQELAVKRTHPSSIDQVEAVPKNQIPNQQFFAKMHQQDLQQSRSFKRQSVSATATSSTPSDITPTKALLSPKMEPPSVSPTVESGIKQEDVSLDAGPTQSFNPSLSRSCKRARLSPSKRPSGSRKSNRQRSQRRPILSDNPAGHGLTEQDVEETRQSFNTPTPDTRIDSKKRRSGAATTPISSIDSPAMGDSVSTPSSNDQTDINAALAPPPAETLSKAPQYIKENGELIRIVRMRQEEIINCICEYGEEDGLMIQCELCLCWQHGACNGIVKEADVPDKYVCYICRNPQRGRDSMRFKHDQDWLFEGKLPVAAYHTANPQATKQFELLKRSHTLTGNLLDAKRSMHSLLVKINIARNRCHPKLYLWAKKWDEDNLDSTALTPVKRAKLEAPDLPNVPQPEAAIDPEECQYRLIEHIKVQQSLVLDRLNDIEAEMDELEKEDTLDDLKDADISTTKEALATFIKELETMKRLAKLNQVANMKQTLRDSATSK
uniref:Protein MBD-R2 n=2 Tax=Drosophila melanogaster TaxID=7227 RepID=MBDR2_DROME|nr:MBD-R2 [Drosophila melanogaster]AAF54781.2 MBD-R2 [Drosophila melanogaster]|eukprot:NP_731688.2 MBD-R2 [Drosophila melanogaster]